MLPADVYARFQRARGHEMLYICATDEHGTPAELAAAEAGQDVGDLSATSSTSCSTTSAARFGLSWDYFGRSSSPQNHELTQHFAERAGGQRPHRGAGRPAWSIRSTTSASCPTATSIGTCPHCGYEAARGDQCDNCGRLLDPVDLMDPLSAISGSREHRGPRLPPPLPAAEHVRRASIRAWIDAKARLAAAGHARSPTSGWTRA